MTVAVIDIGTNTVLLLVAALDDAGGITRLVYEQRSPRLGAGVDSSRRLRPEAMERVVEVLLEYGDLIKRHSPIRTVTCATSAVRDAINREEFLIRVRDRTGFDVEVLSGPDEALWTYRGALSGFPGIGPATVIDVGGGSTEITVGDRTSVRYRRSLTLGAVRLTEREFRHDPPGQAEIAAARRVINTEMDALADGPVAGTTLIGVAGTASALAILDQDLPVFDIASVIGYSLRLDRLERAFTLLSGLRSTDIRALSAVMEGRADVITAGALILREFMSRFRFGSIIVSERGVRYGLALREWERQRTG